MAVLAWERTFLLFGLHCLAWSFERLLGSDALGLQISICFDMSIGLGRVSRKAGRKKGSEAPRA
jgi:hypothetical protein